MVYTSALNSPYSIVWNSASNLLFLGGLQFLSGLCLPLIPTGFPPNITLTLGEHLNKEALVTSVLHYFNQLLSIFFRKTLLACFH